MNKLRKSVFCLPALFLGDEVLAFLALTGYLLTREIVTSELFDYTALFILLIPLGKLARKSILNQYYVETFNKISRSAVIGWRIFWWGISFIMAIYILL